MLCIYKLYIYIYIYICIYILYIYIYIYIFIKNISLTEFSLNYVIFFFLKAQYFTIL